MKAIELAESITKRAKNQRIAWVKYEGKTVLLETRSGWMTSKQVDFLESLAEKENLIFDLYSGEGGWFHFKKDNGQSVSINFSRAVKSGARGYEYKCILKTRKYVPETDYELSYY